MPKLSEQFPSSKPPCCCPICWDELETVAEVARPSVCNHLFCRSCLESLCCGDASLRRCPLDRKPFDRICVRRWTETAETVLMADTLRKLLPSHAAAIGLAVYLLAVLWLAPSWLLVGHIVTICCVYLFTGGTENWDYYLKYNFAFYAFLVPWRFFGFDMAFHACSCGSLIFLWCEQIPRMQASGHWKQDRKLLIGTCFVISVVYPALFFSAYELAKIYCYALWLIEVRALVTNLLAAYGKQCATHAFLLSTLLLAPYLCSRQELTLPYLVYSCLATGYLLLAYHPEITANNTQLQFIFLNMDLSRLACIAFVLTKALGFSVWLTVFTTLASIYLWRFLFPMLMTTRVHERHPELLIVNLAVGTILLPCHVFGFFAYTGCTLVVMGCEIGMSLLLLYLLLMHNFPTIAIALQFAVCGILVPGLLLA